MSGPITLDALALIAFGRTDWTKQDRSKAGSDARRGRNHGLAIERVRTDDDSEYTATEYFRTMGGYLTNQP